MKPKEMSKLVNSLSGAMKAVLTGPVRRSHGLTIASSGTPQTIEALNKREMMKDATFLPLGLKVRRHLGADE